MSENLEITSSVQQRTDKSQEATKVAVMTKFDKILSCPRCNSIETKSCYLNNYNVNQSRHFCRNCQRYWPTGGAIKKLPIRAGRCKSKHASSYLRPVTTSSHKEFLFPFISPTIPEVCIQNITIPLVPSTCIKRLSATYNDCSGNTSTCPSLRKHSRDLNLQQDERNDKGLCLPKTLRIVIDPVAAAKSCIWSTLGIKPPGQRDPVPDGCMFRAFQFRPEANAETSQVFKVLEANPVALSRSQLFRETT
ncbi:hypothetical protein SOVF_073550 [Spinacia oleracea]|uniref:Cyclic dof factor 3 n=1 Tax=Spinacia oleracea TaxID=3562 RepID=A0A9R0K7Q7_SPIOL|nr:cyclic dof factor 3-like [Spinacia oleracea]KNA18130.1 hypothetical protein SOVF_073550 [Spinacia oleracea]